MDPIADALLAVLASNAGDTSGALEHLETARRNVRTAARRHRQLVEIASLLVAGADDRADGLAVLHRTEFDEDTLLVARMTGNRGGPTEHFVAHTSPGMPPDTTQRARRESNPQPSDP